MQIIHNHHSILVFSKTDSDMATGWDIISSEVLRLTELGWNYDTVGNKKSAGLSYRAANIYIYLVHLAININHFMITEGSALDSCIPSTASERYNFSCIDSKLPCLSVKYGANYIKAWADLKEAFNINRDADCGNCCPGIDLMEISHNSACKTFMIGECEPI